MLSSYTYAKSQDDSSGIRVQGDDTLFPQNSYCRQVRMGALGLRHPPSLRHLQPVRPADRQGPPRQRRPTRCSTPSSAAGRSAVIWTLQSGFPITPTVGGTDRSGTGGGFDRPNATGVSPYLDNPMPARWFNIAAFTANAPGTFGNVGRNSLIGPGS